MLDSLFKDMLSNVHSSFSAYRVNKLFQTCSNVRGVCGWDPIDAFIQLRMAYFTESFVEEIFPLLG